MDKDCEIKDTDADISKCTEENISWKDGRRVVELLTITEGLKACTNCNLPLSLSNVTSETREGFASLLYIQCSCKAVNTVHTSKWHKVR